MANKMFASIKYMKNEEGKGIEMYFSEINKEFMSREIFVDL